MVVSGLEETPGFVNTKSNLFRRRQKLKGFDILTLGLL